MIKIIILLDLQGRKKEKKNEKGENDRKKKSVFAKNPPKMSLQSFIVGFRKKKKGKKKKIRHMEKRIDNAEFEVGPWE